MRTTHVETADDLPTNAQLLDYCWVHSENRTYMYDADGWRPVNRQKRDDSDKGKLKTANKIMGRQGETIHVLRAELAQVREENSQLERGELRRLQRRNQVLQDEIVKSVGEIVKLRLEKEALKTAPKLADAAT
jgi:hypothetical protein